MQLDSVQIGAEDLDAACAAYALLFGAHPLDVGNRARRFQLSRGAIEIEPGEAGVHSIRFTTAHGDDVAQWPTTRAAYYGLHVRIEPAPQVSGPFVPRPDAPEAIDHVVVQSPDLDRAI